MRLVKGEAAMLPVVFRSRCTLPGQEEGEKRLDIRRTQIQSFETSWFEVGTAPQHFLQIEGPLRSLQCGPLFSWNVAFCVLQRYLHVECTLVRRPRTLDGGALLRLLHVWLRSRAERLLYRMQFQSVPFFRTGTGKVSY